MQTLGWKPVISIRLFAIAGMMFMFAPGFALGEQGLTSAQLADLPRHFGFDALEIFKIEDGITQLRPADVNGDGRIDLVLANNRKSTIEVLLQRDAPPAEKEQPAEINDLVNDWRFERKRVSVTWRVLCLKVADVTGDSKNDLIFFGDPKELVIMAGRGDGSFGAAETRRVRDGLELSSAMDTGDIDNDGLVDVVMLGESDVLLFRQLKGGGLANVERFSHAIESPRGLGLSDLNGDGRLDLIIVTSDEDYPIWIRYQDSLGHLGPVQRLKLPGLRSLEFATCLDRKANDLFGVERVSGRLKRWRLGVDEQSSARNSAAVLYHPIPGTSDATVLPLAVGDVTGDGLDDLLTANVDAAQIVLFEQEKGIGLLPSKSFGGQTKMRGARCFDADGDGRDELYVVSAEEAAIAVSHHADNRMSFPKAIAVEGKPYAFDIGLLDDSGKQKLVYVSRDDDSEYHLRIQNLEGVTDPKKEGVSIALEDIDEPPTALRLADVNRDGKPDVLIFSAYAPLLACVQKDDGTFSVKSKKTGTQTGLVKQAKFAGYAFADTDGDGKKEVLLAQKTFVRALRINENGAWETLDQYNAPGSDANITGITVIEGKNGARPRLAMYDRQGRELHIFKPEKGTTYALDQSIPVGLFDLQDMRTTRLGGTNQTGILLADKKRIARILPETRAPRAIEAGVYESSIKDAHLTRIAVGDLNHDQRTDLAVIDTKEHAIEILTFGPDEKLIRANKFRVFARKRFQRDGSNFPAPHWVEIVDLTNDGFDDLVLISRDRVLLYPAQ